METRHRNVHILTRDSQKKKQTTKSKILKKYFTNVAGHA